MITYKTSRLDKLPEETLKKLSGLTFRNNGVMYNHIEIALNRLKYGETPKDYEEWLVVAYDGKISVGWSMSLSIYPDQNKKLVSFIGVFVRKEYRRKGIGTHLVEKLKSFLKTKNVNRLVVSPHNKISKDFYNSLGAKEGEVDFTIG